MKRVKLKRKSFKLKWHEVFLLILLLIIAFTIYIVVRFNNSITPKILEVAKVKITNMTSVIITKSFDQDIINKENTGNIMIFNFNDNKEIISADFDLEKIYELARIVSERFTINFNYIENGQIEKIGLYDINAISNNNDGYILKLPIGIASKNIFFSNLGPKIPVKVKFIGTTITSVKSRVTDYGINNALIEIYLSIEIKTQIITPVVFDEVTTTYELLISSKLIQGKVPQLYGGKFEVGNSSLNIPILE